MGQVLRVAFVGAELALGLAGGALHLGILVDGAREADVWDYRLVGRATQIHKAGGLGRRHAKSLSFSQCYTIHKFLDASPLIARNTNIRAIRLKYFPLLLHHHLQLPSAHLALRILFESGPYSEARACEARGYLVMIKLIVPL